MDIEMMMNEMRELCTENEKKILEISQKSGIDISMVIGVYNETMNLLLNRLRNNNS